MNDVAIIGIELAETVFQAHGASAAGEPVFRKKLSRGQLLGLLQRQPPCVVAMEACASAHHWGREIAKLGHEVRLVPPVHVKPFVKRHKTDAADAEAIAEAASRPTMRFAPVKTAEQPSRSMVFETRDLLVRQRTQIAGALRGHLMEHGVVAPPGLGFVRRLAERIEDPASGLPPLVVELARLHLDQLEACTARIAAVERRLKDDARADPDVRRLQTAPGIGPVGAMAIKAFAPPLEGAQCGVAIVARTDGAPMATFAAWLGLVPLQRSTGGRQRLGRTSKRGEPRHPQALDHRGDDPRPVGRPQRRPRGLVARAQAGPQAADARRDRAREQ